MIAEIVEVRRRKGGGGRGEGEREGEAGRSSDKENRTKPKAPRTFFLGTTPSLPWEMILTFHSTGVSRAGPC